MASLVLHAQLCFNGGRIPSRPLPPHPTVRNNDETSVPTHNDVEPVRVW